MTIRNFDHPNFLGTETLVVGQSAPPALLLATPLVHGHSVHHYTQTNRNENSWCDLAAIRFEYCDTFSDQVHWSPTINEGIIYTTMRTLMVYVFSKDIFYIHNFIFYINNRYYDNYIFDWLLTISCYLIY